MPPSPDPAPDDRMAAFLQQIADTFALTKTGSVTLELQYVDGTFRWARMHSGPIGRDELNRMNEAA